MSEQETLNFMSEQETLKPLPYPVYFVSKNSTEMWKELMNSSTPPPVEQLYERLLHTRDTWSVQTYIQLKRQGLDVHLVSHYVPGSICITTYDDLLIRDLPFNSYVVACRHDRGRPEICEQRIVQNQLNVIDHTDHLLTLWSQPNLQPRDQSRGTKVENIVFKGMAINLAEPFKSPEFLTRLQSLGISLSVSPADLEARFAEWTDYTKADVVLAVRNCTEYDLSIKPPGKLINAWFAGCPAFLGPEPAYQSLRESELDYIEVRSPDDVITALLRLRDAPALYSAMVDNGFRRAKTFTSDCLALCWRDLLAGSIADGYERWLRQSPIQKLVGRPAQFAWRAIKHKRESRHFFINIRSGSRLFSDSVPG